MKTDAQIRRRSFDLRDALSYDPGYHGTTWVDLRTGPDGHNRWDPMTPEPLQAFIQEVDDYARRNGLDDRSFGTAYLRIIDAGEPENDGAWHRDNMDDGGVRFTTAFATDPHMVQLAFVEGRDAGLYVGAKTIDTYTTPDIEWWQPANGELVVFTDEPHGVLPLPARPDQKTAVFFTTLYRTRSEADIEVCRNKGIPQRHTALPVLEETR